MVRTSIKYKPLYDLLLVDKALENFENLSEEKQEYYTKLSKVDTVIITGGRFSGKSYEVGEWSVEATLQHDYKILYTRFTNVSMSDSVIPEIKEKISDNNYNHLFNFSNNKFYSKCGEGLISFKGLKAGSGQQTANLKSLKGFNVQVTDEAEEIPDYKTFEKVYFSIRSKDKQNISILILNPTTTDHWIFETFYKSRNIQEGHNGIKDNVLYIHTSYLDVDPKVIPQNILNTFNDMKVRNPNSYNEIVMGGWISDLEGALYKREELSTFSISELNTSNAIKRIAHIDPADRGTDSLAMPIAYVIGDLIYIVDVYFTQDNQEVTIPEISFKAKQHQLDTITVETNGIGLAYFEKMSNFVGSPCYPLNQTGNKHRRIISTSGFIRNYFVFRNDYEQGSHYDLFMRELFAYMKDDKENKGTKHNDDAPDSLDTLWRVCNDELPEHWV